MIRVDAEKLRETVTRLFVGLGLPQGDAATVADNLVESDLMGVSSHGVSNYIEHLYAPGLRAGTIEAAPDIHVVHETPVTALLDGGGGLGHVVGRRGMDLAIEKARDAGLGLVTVRNSRHYGAAGVYSVRALEHDMIGISMTNSDALVLPTFGRDARIGTNPISVAVPSGQEDPFLLDMATSTVPLGKLMLARRAGAELPEGWATDGEAELTTDAEAACEARRLLPLGGSFERGGHKGYGLGVLVDVLCGVLSGVGAGSLGGLGGAVGHFFGAIRIDAFRPVDEFKRGMDVYLRYLLETRPKSEEEPVIYAGTKEARARRDRLENGIPLHPAVLDYLRGLGAELGTEVSI